MIKINLLGVAPPPSKASPVGGPPAPMATQVVMFVGALIILFGIVGVVYKVLSSEIDGLTKARARETARKTELAVVKAQNDKYQQRLKDLETRINTIQALQNGRVGPVELMSSLGNVVNKTPEIYLYTLTPTGERFSLKGQSANVDAMANFIASMKNSGFFADVQLDQFYQDDIKERLSYKFALSCQFKSPEGGASPTSGATATPLPGGPGGPGPLVPGGPNMPGLPGPGGRPMPPTPEAARAAAGAQGQGPGPGPGQAPAQGQNLKLIR